MSRTPLTEEDRGALESLGRNLARIRKSRGFTQERFAELVGLHPRVVQKIEYGQTNLRTTTTARILRVLQVSWEMLLGSAAPDPDLAAVAEDPETNHQPEKSRKASKKRRLTRPS